MHVLASLSLIVNFSSILLATWNPTTPKKMMMIRMTKQLREEEGVLLDLESWSLIMFDISCRAGPQSESFLIGMIFDSNNYSIVL